MTTPTASASLPELVRTLADDARELVKAEVGLAKDELGKNLKAGLFVIAGATAATVVAVLALCAFVAAFVLAAGGTPIAALSASAGVGAALVALALVVSLRMLAQSKPRSTADAEQLRTRASEPRVSSNQGEVLR
jgi:hypothetical protein